MTPNETKSYFRGTSPQYCWNTNFALLLLSRYSTTTAAAVEWTAINTTAANTKTSTMPGQEVDDAAVKSPADGLIRRGNKRQVTPEELQNNKTKRPLLSFEHADNHQVNSVCRKDEENENKRRRSLFHSKSSSDEEVDLNATQPFEFTQDSDAEDDDEDEKPLVVVKDAANGSTMTLKPRYSSETRSFYSVGRDTCSSLLCAHDSVGRKHAEIVHDQRDGSFLLHAYKECWIRDSEAKKWTSIPAGSEKRIDEGQSFRVLPNASQKALSTTPAVQFALEIFDNHSKKSFGSVSIDHEYLGLLRSVKRNGQHQANKKGGNTTLREQVTLKINLTSNDNTKNLLPVTTLRRIYPLAAILEAIWYLRGENHVRFLQRNNQKFWDKQAVNSWIGYNYGLLTTYPDPRTTDGKQINQLEENVLKPLVAGMSSRNMVCTLCKPGEPTLQQACTSSVQFAVSGDDNQLDLTVTQRSSDVILGLPNDVVVWSILLHLVRREVGLRTNGQRELRAGMLNFCISGGGAHVYDVNAQNFDALLDRKPIIPKNEDAYPCLVVDDLCGSMGMLDIAHTYEDDVQNCKIDKLRVTGYTSYHPPMKIEQAIDP